MIPVIVGVLAFVWMLLERTRFGRSVRASIQDKEAAFLQGINFDWTSAIVMLIAGFLAGLAGALTSLTMEVSPQMGSLLILKAFIIVIVGGMGSVGGTVVAAVLLGFLDVTVAMVFNPRVTPLFGAIVMLLVLLIKPRGLFGHE
jgi:branched-subunit amino acid ABC-type transport system permease component